MMMEDASTKPVTRQRLSRVVAGVLGVCVGLAVGLGVAYGYRSPPSSSTAAATAPGPSGETARLRPVIVFVGDSVTQMASDPIIDGFVARIQAQYVRAADVLNRAVTVYNTKAFVSTALPVLEGELSTWLSPAVIAVWFGVNDAALIGGRSEAQRVDVAKYKQHLVTMLKRLRTAAPNAKLLLMTPPTVDDEARLADHLRAGLPATAPLDRSNTETAKYAAACRDVVGEVDGVAMLDMYKYLMETYPNATARGTLQGDGLHFNSEGHKVVFEQLKTKIESLLPGFSSDSVQVPEWDKLNDKYPANKND